MEQKFKTFHSSRRGIIILASPVYSIDHRDEVLARLYSGSKFSRIDLFNATLAPSRSHKYLEDLLKRMINLKIFDVTLVTVVTVAASIGWGTIGFQGAMAIGLGSGPVSLLNEEEAVETENVTMAGFTNQTTTSRNATEVEFLSIQTAQFGSISQINETSYTLELNNVANKTNLFSDRPERIVETVSTADFVGNWTDGRNSFASDAPNDALIVENAQTGKLETAIIELFSPNYDTDTNTLAYTIMAENGTSVSLPREFGQSILVVDSSTTYTGRFIDIDNFGAIN